VTKGAIGAVMADGAGMVDPARRGEPADFWRGYTCRLLDDRGTVVDERVIAHFDSAGGEIGLDEPFHQQPLIGQAHELSAGKEAPVLAIRYLLGLRLDQEIPPLVLKPGTTRGTNALITRRGARAALVTTCGFADILRIGYQNRPRLFDLIIKKPKPLFEAVVEIDERVTPDGEVLLRPNFATIRSSLADLRDRGVESLTVCLWPMPFVRSQSPRATTRGPTFSPHLAALRPNTHARLRKNWACGRYSTIPIQGY